MSVLRFVLRSAGVASAVMSVLGTASAAFNAGLIACVHRALRENDASHALALAFVGLGLGKIISAYASGRVTDSYSFESATALRRELIRKLLSVPFRRFEQVGQARAYAALTGDIAVIHAALQATANAVVNAAILIGAAAYLLYLDVRAFGSLLLLFAAGFAVYRVMRERARALLSKARDEHDRLFEHFGALTRGIKELQQHAARRRAFLDGPMLETTETMMQYDITGNARYLLGQAVNGTLVLILIGVVLFALPFDAQTRAGSVSGYVLTGLYLVGPLSSLLRLQPLYAAAEIALRRIERLGIDLGAADDGHAADASAQPTFERIELNAVTHRYGDAHASDFVLGPVSLYVVPSEILFITGGNGSGKSTLAKLVTGLYEPASGDVVWDGRAVSERARDMYRQLFSAVFSEFHVFDRLYGLPADGLDERARRLIEELGLAGSVRVEHGRLSAVDLSSGQRKRLALLTALLEDRPIYVFDEWAADQDAEFKQVFYRQILPRLRERGKAVIVISHDDRFFDIADRLLQLDGGRAREDAAAKARASG